MPHVSFDESKLNPRVKLVALWCAVMFCYIYGDYFALYIPKEAEKLVSGDTLLNSPMRVFGASVLMCLPSLVIISTLFARANVARVLNIVFGVIFTGIMLLIVFTSFPLTPEISAYVFYALLESAMTMTIVWQAWTWPRVSV